MSGDRGSVSGVLVCWSLDLGSTPDGSLSFSFPLAFFGLCKSISKGNKSYFMFSPSHTSYVHLIILMVMLLHCALARIVYWTLCCLLRCRLLVLVSLFSKYYVVNRVVAAGGYSNIHIWVRGPQ